MSWNPAQQAMLEAMGYTLWHHAGAGAAAPLTAMPDASPGAATAAVAGPAASRVRDTDSVTGADALLRAMQRAAGGADLSGLALPPLAALRGDARAKRALWPRLRALRRR